MRHEDSNPDGENQMWLLQWIVAALVIAIVLMAALKQKSAQ